MLNSVAAVISGDVITFGSVPVTATPRERNKQYSYIFTGWTGCIEGTQRACTFTANFDRVVNEYPVVFQNDDGTVLRSGMVAYGETPEYTGADPSKDTDTLYAYSWTGWSPRISSVVT